MKSGKINVETKNIFPIIKKFLYSDQEIFLRELISNAVDATQKLKTLSSIGEFKGELGDIKIEVFADEKARTISVKDKGIGMTAEEIDKYINQIAFSSAEDFIKKFKNNPSETNSIIGHFGLGFYSSFIVADKVKILTKSYKKGPGTKASKWECKGNPEFTITDIDKKDRGTEVILHLSDDYKEFLEEYKILSLLKKYCKFLPVEIQFGTEKVTEKLKGEKDKDGKDKTIEVEKPRIINNTKPAWIQKPSKLKDEDYKNFYRELYPLIFEDPLFHIHLNVDYPFTLTGILYFPKLKKNFEIQKNKIQLYCNQVFVTDSIENIVPDYLTLLHGVIDSPDIPLNVSRSALQNDRNVKKISDHISKKVADKLEEIFNKNRVDFEKKWDDIKIFIQYGMISDTKFYERAKKFCLFKNTEDKYFTLDEYDKKIKNIQTDKDKKLVHLYTNNVENQHSFVQTAKQRGYDVLVMDGPIDSHFINMIEQKNQDSSFVRVDSDVIDKLIKKEDAQPSKLTEDDEKKLKPIIEKIVPKEKYNITFESLSEKAEPVIVTQPEFSRRMKDMSAVSGGGMMFAGNMPEIYNLVINSNHTLISQILEEKDESRQSKTIKQIVDLALISQNMLRGEELTNFVKRSIDLIK